MCIPITIDHVESWDHQQEQCLCQQNEGDHTSATWSCSELAIQRNYVDPTFIVSRCLFLMSFINFHNEDALGTVEVAIIWGNTTTTRKHVIYHQPFGQL